MSTNNFTVNNDLIVGGDCIVGQILSRDIDCSNVQCDNLNCSTIGGSVTLQNILSLDTVNSVQNQLDDCAKLDTDNTFTGNLYYKTHSPNDSSVKLASTEFVQGCVNNAINTLVGTAPQNLNTIYELAAEISGNETLMNTYFNQLNLGKADLSLNNNYLGTQTYNNQCNFNGNVYLGSKLLNGKIPYIDNANYFSALQSFNNGMFSTVINLNGNDLATTLNQKSGLSTTNTFSGAQTYSNAVNFNGNVNINGKTVNGKIPYTDVSNSFTQPQTFSNGLSANTISLNGSDLSSSLVSLNNSVSSINNSYVNLSGNQVISGTKTFSSVPILPANSITNDKMFNSCISSGYCDATSSIQTQLNSKPGLNANNTYNGTQTFRNDVSITGANLIVNNQNVISRFGGFDTSINSIQSTVNTHDTSINTLITRANNHDTSLNNLQSKKLDASGGYATCPTVQGGLFINNYAYIPQRTSSQVFGAIASNWSPSGARDVNFWNVGYETQTDNVPAFTFEKVNSDGVTERNLVKILNSGTLTANDISTNQITSLNNTIASIQSFLSSYPMYSFTGSANYTYGGAFTPGYGQATRPLVIQFSNNNGGSTVNQLFYPCVFRITCYFYKGDRSAYGQTTCDLMILPAAIRAAWGGNGSTIYNMNNNINGSGSFGYTNATYAPYGRQYWAYNQVYTDTSGPNGYLSGYNNGSSFSVAIYFCFNYAAIYTYSCQAIDISSTIVSNLSVSINS